MDLDNSGNEALDREKLFLRAVNLFDSRDWFLAHDAFEELWMETHGPERSTLQGLLQVAVAQLHIQRGNRNGATILLGEGLGRLKTLGRPDLGLDLYSLCIRVEECLAILQQDVDLEEFIFPPISKRV